MIGLDVQLWFWAITGTVWSTDEPLERAVGADVRRTPPEAVDANEQPAAQLRAQTYARPRLFIERRAYQRGHQRVFKSPGSWWIPAGWEPTVVGIDYARRRRTRDG